MITCAWCEADAWAIVEDVDESYRCPACGTCVDLVEEPVALDDAA